MKLENIPLACPIDNCALQESDNRYICEKGHSYDLARQGYINLLPVQFKSSKDPGDSREMVQARRRVLAEGYFNKLSEQLSATVCQYDRYRQGESGLLVDAGCGEGFYTESMANSLLNSSRLNDQSMPCAVLGVDISKWSVLAAAKKYKQVDFAVGTNKRLPLIHGSIDIITSLFGFESWNDWAAIQNSGQFVVTVDAGERHLYELREQIYDEVRFHKAPPDDVAVSAGYTPVDSISVLYTNTSVQNQTICDLLEMTPHGRRINRDARLRMEKLECLNMTIDALVRVYRRT